MTKLNSTNNGADRGVPSSTGTLMLIGGNEDKAGDRSILREVAARVGNGRLIVATLASQEPDWQWRTYSEQFAEFGLRDVVHLRAETRELLQDCKWLKLMEECSAVFFTGATSCESQPSLAALSYHTNPSSV